MGELGIDGSVGGISRSISRETVTGISTSISSKTEAWVWFLVRYNCRMLQQLFSDCRSTVQGNYFEEFLPQLAS